jgi:hypothetical protein
LLLLALSRLRICLFQLRRKRSIPTRFFSYSVQPSIPKMLGKIFALMTVTWGLVSTLVQFHWDWKKAEKSETTT